MIVISPNANSYGGIERTIELMREHTDKPVHVVKMPNKPMLRRAEDWRCMRLLRQYLRENPSEPIYVRNFYNLFWVWITLRITFAKNPIFYQSPGVYPAQIFYQFQAKGVSPSMSRRLTWVFARLEQFLLRRCKGLFVFNDFLKVNYMTWYPSKLLAEKLHVIAPGHDYNWGETPSTSDEATKGPDILYFGRFDAQKGLAELVGAIKNTPNVTLKLIGHGRQEKLLRSLADDAQNIAFHEPIFDKLELAAEIKAARFCAFPSIYEPYGHTIWESISLGTPVVALNREIGRFTGHGYDEGKGSGVNLFDTIDDLISFAQTEDGDLDLDRPSRTWQGYVREVFDVIGDNKS